MDEGMGIFFLRGGERRAANQSITLKILWNI